MQGFGFNWWFEVWRSGSDNSGVYGVAEVVSLICRVSHSLFMLLWRLLDVNGPANPNLSHRPYITMTSP